MVCNNMTLPRLALAVIGDEIGPSLDEMISFAHEHGIKRLDMRSVGGRSLLSMTHDEVIAISDTLDKAGLIVPTFVAPVLKWPAPGNSSSGGKNNFAFDPKECPVDDPLMHAMEIAVILNALNVRIFSHLRYDGFRPPDLAVVGGQLATLLGHANHFDITLQLESARGCNIDNIAELANFFRTQDAEKQEREVRDLRFGDDKFEGEPKEIEEAIAPDEHRVYLRPLVDIGNAWASGKAPTDSDIAILAPLTTAITLKDHDEAAGKAVPLGDGNVPWAVELTRLLSGVRANQVLASIETQCPEQGGNATARSVMAISRIAQDVGVELI